MQKKYSILKLIKWFLLFATMTFDMVIAQNNALILKSNPYIILNGGTSATPVNLIINQVQTTGISGSGYIKSEGEFNYVDWVIGTGIGTYTVPFYDNTHTTSIPFSMAIGNAATGAGHVLFSTYTASATLTPYATYNATTSIPNLETEYPIGGDNSANMVQRWWIADAASYDSYTTFAKRPSNITFTFEFHSAEIHSQALASLGFQPFADNASETEWDPSITFAQLSSTPGTPNQVISPNISASDFFRAWALVNSSSLLPIDLLSFNAVCKGEKVSLNWATASETNNDYFTIDRSKDAETWETMVTIPGAGNSNTTLYYSAIDNQPYPGYTYYRLKQTDYNGNFKLFNVISSDCNTDSISSLAIYPNPINSVLNIKTGMANNNFDIKIINMEGQVCYTNNFTGNASFDLSILKSALYYVIITNLPGGELLKQRIVVL